MDSAYDDLFLDSYIMTPSSPPPAREQLGLDRSPAKLPHEMQREEEEVRRRSFFGKQGIMKRVNKFQSLLGATVTSRTSRQEDHRATGPSHVRFKGVPSPKDSRSESTSMSISGGTAASADAGIAQDMSEHSEHTYDDISVIPLEELLKDEFVDTDLEIAQKDPSFHAQVREAFRSALQCVYSPFYAQLEKNLAMDDASFIRSEENVDHGNEDQSDSTAIDELEDDLGTPISSSALTSSSEPVFDAGLANPCDFQWKLVRTLRHAFRGLVTESEFRSDWMQFVSESSFETQYPCDLTLRALEQRKNSIPNHPYFRKEQFAIEEQYETWMQNEINTVDKLIETALEVRKHKVNMVMHVDLRNVVFFRGVRKINTELRLRCGGAWAGDWVKCTEYDPDAECYVFDWDSRPGFDREYRERIGRERVEFVHKKNIFGKSLVAGYFDVNIHSILKSLQSPLPRNWSQGVFEKKVEIKNAKGQAVGEADVSVLLKFHFFPSTSSRRTVAKQSEQIVPDYHYLYEILVSRIVKMHRINETTSERTILNFYERFILEEFALIYGIHEVFRRITSLKALAPRLDLITPFSDEIMRDIQFIHIAIEMDSFIVTLDDRRQLKQVIHTLDEKIFNLICDFKKYFPRNRPKGAFSTFFEIWWMIRTKYEGQSVDDDRGTLAVLCRDMVRKAIAADYDSIVDAVSTFDSTVHSGISILDKDSAGKKRRKSLTSGIGKYVKGNDGRVLAGSVLSQVCRVLEGRINDTFNFSGIFPEDVKYEMISVKKYYELLRSDVELFLASNGGPNNLPPFDVLQIWSDMSRLHKTIIFNFEDVGELDFNFINLDIIAREQVPRWMAELREKLLLYKTESIALDKYDEKSGLLHSTSVVDLFSAGNQMLEFIRGLDFVTLDILQSFVQVICDVTIEYARAMEDRCLLQLTERRAVVSSASQSHSTDDVTTEIVIDFASLREGVLKESDNFVLELPPLLVTRDFIIKLNNIEAARQQLNQIIEAVENSKNEYFDTETEDYDDWTDDTATTVSDFDDSSHSTAISTVQPTQEAAEYNKKSTFRALNNMLDEVVVILATQFQPFAHACLTELVALAAGHKDLTEQQVQRDFQAKIDQVLESQLLEPVLTPSFISLNEHMYFDLFLRVLKRIYGTTLREIESLILPARDFINRQKVQYLTIPQVYVLKSSLVPLFLFFRGGESDRGLSKEWLKDETRWVAQIIKIFDRPTERLISFYKKRFVDNEQPENAVKNMEEEKQKDSEATVTSQPQPQLQLQFQPEKRLPNVRDIIEEEEKNEEIETLKRIEERRRMHSFTSVASVASSVASARTSDKKKSYIDRIIPIQIFLIIAARADYDKMAARFVSEYKDIIMGLTLHEHLGLDPAQIVYETFHCFNHRMTPGRVIITSVYLLFQRLKMTGTGYSTKKQNMIRLMDVDDIKRSTSLMGKGFTIRATPATGADRQSYILKLYFSRNATREKFFKSLAEHARAAGNKLFESRQTAENLRIEPASETPLNSLAEIPSTTRRSLDRVAMEDEVRHSFGVDRSEILIDRFKCALKDQPGFLFIFTQCMCFRGTLDTSIKLTIPFSEVLRIEKSSLSHINISLSSGITFEFKKFANRHHAYGVIFSQWDSFIERSSVSSYATSGVFSANGTGGPKSYTSGLSTASTSNLFKQRRKSIVGKIMSSTRRKSLPVGSAQRPSVSDEDQDHFYKTFDSIEPDELLIAKYDRISYGSATGQLGTLYISTRHVCFEPAVMSSDKWVSISVSDIKEVVVKRSRMLVGRTMKLRLRNGGKVKFHIRSTSNDAIDLVKRLIPPFQASYV